MPFLSQAAHLGSLLLPHAAFQEYAAHLAEWSAELNSKRSEVYLHTLRSCDIPPLRFRGALGFSGRPMSLGC